MQSQKSRISLYDRVSDSSGKFVDQRTKDLRDKENFTPDLVEDVVQSLESYNITELADQTTSQLNNIQVRTEWYKLYIKKLLTTNGL